MAVLLAGFLQKKGGGTSLLGSKGWSQRYVRIEVRRGSGKQLSAAARRAATGATGPPLAAERPSQSGELSWWKSKNDASTGAAPQKDARVPLKQYHLEVDTKGDGKYFSFAIIAKDKKLLTSP
ncbi:unnamed protein product [Symbiodinium sp. KB8]|nr:unnamed protein product [Symbiodinium sp. KB8]